MSWNPKQLIDTLSFFEALPFQKQLNQMFDPNSKSKFSINDGVLFNFLQPNDLTVWGAVDDVVMGGQSNSGLESIDGKAVFKGNISIEGGGGFASIRTRNFEPALNLSDYRQLKLQVKGDGNRYKFLVRDSASWDSVAYSFSFNTKLSEWIEVPILFEEMIPVFRARSVEPRTILDKSRICALQIMLSKFEYDGKLNSSFSPGPFELAINSIVVE